jgi:hypothetical protein
VVLQRLLAGLLQVGIPGVVEQQAAQVERDREMPILLLSEGRLLGVVESAVVRIRLRPGVLAHMQLFIQDEQRGGVHQ